MVSDAWQNDTQTPPETPSISYNLLPTALVAGPELGYPAELAEVVSMGDSAVLTDASSVDTLSRADENNESKHGHTYNESAGPNSARGHKPPQMTSSRPRRYIYRPCLIKLPTYRDFLAHERRLKKQAAREAREAQERRALRSARNQGKKTPASPRTPVHTPRAHSCVPYRTQSVLSQSKRRGVMSADFRRRDRLEDTRPHSTSKLTSPRHHPSPGTPRRTRTTTPNPVLGDGQPPSRLVPDNIVYNGETLRQLCSRLNVCRKFINSFRGYTPLKSRNDDKDSNYKKNITSVKQSLLTVKTISSMKRQLMFKRSNFQDRLFDPVDDQDSRSDDVASVYSNDSQTTRATAYSLGDATDDLDISPTRSPKGSITWNNDDEEKGEEEEEEEQKEKEEEEDNTKEDGDEEDNKSVANNPPGRPESAGSSQSEDTPRDKTRASLPSFYTASLSPRRCRGRPKKVDDQANQQGRSPPISHHAKGQTGHQKTTTLQPLASIPEQRESPYLVETPRSELPASSNNEPVGTGDGHDKSTENSQQQAGQATDASVAQGTGDNQPLQPTAAEPGNDGTPKPAAASLEDEPIEGVAAANRSPAIATESKLPTDVPSSPQSRGGPGSSEGRQIATPSGEPLRPSPSPSMTDRSTQTPTPRTPTGAAAKSPRPREGGRAQFRKSARKVKGQRTKWHGNGFRITGPLCGECTGDGGFLS